MLNLHRWDLYIRHFLAFMSLNWNCDRWRSYLRRWSRSAMTLRVVGCLEKPVCFSKYCDIQQSLTVHRSLARYCCRPTQSTTSSLLNANFTHACPYSRQNFFATWKRRRLKQSTHCTAEKLAQRLLFLLFLLRRHERWSNNSNTRPVLTASYLRLSHVYTDVTQFLFSYLINKPTTLLHPSAYEGLPVKSQRDVAS